MCEEDEERGRVDSHGNDAPGGGGRRRQTQMQVYFAEGTLDVQQAHRLIELTQRAYPQAEWDGYLRGGDGESLRERILSDRAPQIAVCAPAKPLHGPERACWRRWAGALPIRRRCSRR